MGSQVKPSNVAHDAFFAHVSDSDWLIHLTSPTFVGCADAPTATNADCKRERVFVAQIFPPTERRHEFVKVIDSSERKPSEENGTVLLQERGRPSCSPWFALTPNYSLNGLRPSRRRSSIWTIPAAQFEGEAHSSPLHPSQVVDLGEHVHLHPSSG